MTLDPIANVISRLYGLGPAMPDGGDAHDWLEVYGGNTANTTGGMPILM